MRSRTRKILVTLVGVIAITSAGLVGAAPAQAATHPDYFEIIVSPVAPMEDTADVWTRFNGTFVPMTVGKLTSVQPNGEKMSCTASVVNTPQGNTLQTAAHCLYSIGDGAQSRGAHTKIKFVPAWFQYSINSQIYDAQPFGEWIPIGTPTIPNQWKQATQNTGPIHKYDHAFLSVKPAPDSTYPGNKKLQDIVGANGMAIVPNGQLPVKIVGYPRNTSAPITINKTTASCSLFDGCLSVPVQNLGFTYTDPDTGQVENVKEIDRGSSGGPWLTSFQSDTYNPNRGTIIAVTSMRASDDADPNGSQVSNLTKDLYTQHVAANHQ